MPGCAAYDLQSAGQYAGTVITTPDAALHEVPEFLQTMDDFCLTAPAFLIGHHHGGDTQVMFMALAQQFCTGTEWISQCRLILDDTVLRSFVLVDHETATDGIIVPFQQQLTRVVPG